MQTCRVAHHNLFRFASIFLSCVVLLFFAVGCESCSSENAVATIATKNGDVDRSTQSTQQHWATANIGNVFQIGDAVRTRKNSGAELSLDDGSLLALEEETVIRFLDREPDSNEQSFDLQLGTASLEAPKSGTSLRTLFGMARLEGGTKIQIRRKGDVMRYEVLLGSAKLESVSGEEMRIQSGQRVEVSLGQASLELIESDETRPLEEAEKNDVSRMTGPISATVKGSSVELLAPGGDSYSKLAAGDTALQGGSTLKVGVGSSVIVTQGSDKAELAAGGTYVVGGNQLVSAQSGTVTVTAEGMMKVAVPGGFIVTQGSATISSVPKGTKVQAKSGKVSLLGKTQETITGGEEGFLAVNGDVKVEGRGVARTDYQLAVGQSVVIHDPAPPTAVRFLFAKKCEQGIVRLKGSKSSLPGDSMGRGTQSTALLIATGGVHYDFHCLDKEGKESESVASGNITVLHDTGSRSMPKNAPSTTVDVNGRGYTVLYQNQLPKVTLRWSTAPAGVSEFQLHVSGGGRNRTITTSGPSYTFTSGGLGGGAHTVYFTGGGRVSRRSTVSIQFDNATPTASLSTPVDTGVSPGGVVHVSGTALPGWSASVDGKPLEQDGNNRFTMKTSMPSDGRALAVYLTHPSRGSHVYLRRPAGIQ